MSAEGAGFLRFRGFRGSARILECYYRIVTYQKIYKLTINPIFNMEKDITPELMKIYFESGKLGTLVETIPGCGIVTVDLSQLFKHATGLKFFEFQTSPENIEVMAVYGSTLYNHFPTEEQVPITKRKYLLWGPKETVVKTIQKPRHFPNDFDVMVITKEGFSDDKVIIPKRHLKGDGYGSWEVIDFTAVGTKRNVSDGYGYFEVKGDANLHITYRSVEQFLAGLGKGDELSESVVRYGIPLIGQGRFSEIVKDITSPRREATHRVEWDEDLEGKLQGKIL